MVAGASPLTAVILGLSMTSLQFAIGALNDLHDAATDAGRVPPKPIPAGLVAPDMARLVVIGAASVGLVLAATFGTGLLVLAGLVLVVGFGYDLLLRGTLWSWLPFAVGIPILPVYGWFGATGEVPDRTIALIAAAALAGTALAVANARADQDRDREAGVVTIATQLGERASLVVLVIAWGAAAAVALRWLLAAGSPPIALLPLLAAIALIGAGVIVGRRGGHDRLEWAWRIQAIGAGLAAVAWLAAVVSPG
jgi:geranylgeranylglycerol-phosphate geranylgeranyltransferase